MGQSKPRDLESIGRFSRRAGIPVSHLRHYHELGLLQPAFVDPESGYRYYAVAQRESAEVIRLLHSIDMPVRDIQRVLADPSEATVREVLAAHRARLEERLTQIAGRLEAIDRIVKEGKLVKQPSQVAEDGFVSVRVDSVHAHTPSAERWRELREKLPSILPRSHRKFTLSCSSRTMGATSPYGSEVLRAKHCNSIWTVSRLSDP